VNDGLVPADLSGRFGFSMVLIISCKVSMLRLRRYNKNSFSSNHCGASSTLSINQIVTGLLFRCFTACLCCLTPWCRHFCRLTVTYRELQCRQNAFGLFVMLSCLTL
jgi:hypothetical protein